METILTQLQQSFTAWRAASSKKRRSNTGSVAILFDLINSAA